jgi:hypothetical protein
MKVMLMGRGKDPNVLEEMYDKCKMDGAHYYEELINNKNREDAKELIISAYEDVLQDKREKECAILNG